MGLTFIAFEGYEIIVQTGEEVKNPRKNIPRAIFISLTLVVLLYCLVAFVSIGAISPNDTGGIPVWNFIGQNGDCRYKQTRRDIFALRFICHSTGWDCILLGRTYVRPPTHQ